MLLQAVWDTALVVMLCPQTAQQRSTGKFFILLFTTLTLQQTATSFVSCGRDQGRRTKQSLESISLSCVPKGTQFVFEQRAVAAAARCKAAALPQEEEKQQLKLGVLFVLQFKTATV